MMKKRCMRLMAAALLFCSLFSFAAQASGWAMTGNKWFYWQEDGSCAKNQWIVEGDGITRYWVNEDGTMAANQWICDNGLWYYADANGNILKNQMLDLDNGTKHYWLDADGVMASNEWIQTEDGSWYYMQGDGSAIGKGWHNIEGDDYYFLKSCKLVTNATVPGGGYVGADGRKTK